MTIIVVVVVVVVIIKVLFTVTRSLMMTLQAFDRFVQTLAGPAAEADHTPSRKRRVKLIDVLSESVASPPSSSAAHGTDIRASSPPAGTSASMEKKKTKKAISKEKGYSRHW